MTQEVQTIAQLEQKIEQLQKEKAICLSAKETLIQSIRELDENLQKEIADTKTETEVTKTYNLLAQAIGEIEEVVEIHGPLAPFYDLASTQLESILIDITSSVEKGQTTMEKLKFLESQVPQENMLLKEKITASIADLSLLDSKLAKMEEECQKEKNKSQKTKKRCIVKHISLMMLMTLTTSKMKKTTTKMIMKIMQKLILTRFE